MIKKVRLNMVQLGLVSLVEPYSLPSGQEKYTVQVIVSFENKESISTVKALLEEMVSIKGQKVKSLEMLPVVKYTGNPTETPKIVIKCYNKVQPFLLDKHQNRLAADKFHKGDFVDVELAFDTYNREGENGINCQVLKIYKDTGIAI